MREPAGELGLQMLANQRTRRDLQLGPEVMQVPAQITDQRAARLDQPLAMGAEQANLKLHTG